MKHAYLFAAALALAIIGCGGSGTGDTNPNPTVPGDTTNSSNLMIEAVLAPNGAEPSNPANYVVQDPLNIETNQNVKFQLVSYDSAGNRRVLPAESWRTNDTGSVYGQLGTNSGLLIVGSRTTDEELTVEAVYQGRTYTTAYRVRPRQATLRGQVLDSTTGKPIRGASVEFYNSAGTIVGRVRQPFQGFFRASVPLNAAFFQVRSESLPAAFRRAFRFEGLNYEAGSDFCRAPLPALSFGDNLLTSNPDEGQPDESAIRIIPRSQAEPTLDGCFGG